MRSRENQAIESVTDSDYRNAQFIVEDGDITAGNLSEATLYAGHHLLRRITEVSPDLIYIYDLAKQRNVYANREIMQILGYTPEQVQGLGAELFSTLIHPDDLAIVTERILQFAGLSDGAMIETEYRIRHLDVIISQAQRLNKIISMLLDISRIQTGQLSLHREPLDLRALLRGLIDEIRMSLSEHTIDADLPDESLLIDGDELRLEQVFQNLIQNAVKYSPNGGAITVRAVGRQDAVCVEVIDQGISIPADALPQLFQRFFRAPNSGGYQIAGIGIGLYVVREIVELHGGTVTATSVEGQGSEFTVRLPFTYNQVMRNE
jgi:PAS domain S-box-containing protein